MGADLYIESISSKLQEKYDSAFTKACEKRNCATNSKEKEILQKEVDKIYDKMFGQGYFRDSYNNSSLFWLMELSWWQTNIDDEGLMQVEECKKLLEIVKGKKIPTVKELESKLIGRIDDKEDIQGWHKYFVDKKKKFIKFLEKAIELNETIRCSV
jgi:hypothetical protein